MNDIIKQIESLYIEGDEPDRVIKELCEQVYNKDCPFCYKGVLYERSEKVEGLCDCITEQFKDNYKEHADFEALDDKIFNYFNDKYPDEMHELMAPLT